MTNNQLYFANYLPKLTDVPLKEKQEIGVEKMLNYFLEKLLT